MGKFNDLKQEYRSSLKSMDTEERIDLMFYRPIGFFWAKLASKLGITPNAITIASIFLGVIGGCLFFFYRLQDVWLNYLGMLLIIWANSFDSADGQLARMTQQYSRLGRILDGVSSNLWFIAIYFALCLRETFATGFFSQYSILLWVIAAIAGVCHTKQAAMADYYRQFHLFFIKGENGSELDSCDQLDEELARLSWRKQPFKKLYTFFYRHYTANQEVLTPNMQKLRRTLKKKFLGASNIPQSLRDDFRKCSKPLMKYTNMLSFNLRTIILFISVSSRMPWLYFVFEITVLTAMLVHMMLRHEKFCKKLNNDLIAGKYDTATTSQES